VDDAAVADLFDLLADVEERINLLERQTRVDRRDG